MGQSEPADLAPDATDADEKRDVVAQATGILVAQFGINTEDALTKLAAVASDNARPIDDVAHEIVENNGL